MLGHVLWLMIHDYTFNIPSGILLVQVGSAHASTAVTCYLGRGLVYAKLDLRVAFPILFITQNYDTEFRVRILDAFFSSVLLDDMVICFILS